MSWTWTTTISVVLTFEIESRTLYSKSLNVNYRCHEDMDLEDTIQLGNSEVLRIGDWIVKDQGHKRIVPREVFQKTYRQKVAYKYVDEYGNEIT